MAKIAEAAKAFVRVMLNDKGQEVPQKRAPALPVGYRRPPTLEERMRQMIRGSMSLKAQEEGFETFEEANDFDVDDPEDIVFKDEDDEFAANDPFLEEGAKGLKADLQKKASKRAKEAPSGPSRQPSPKGSESRLKNDSRPLPEGPESDSEPEE